MNHKTRKFLRSPIELKAQFLLEKEKRDWEWCTITNASREGMGILFQTCKTIKVGSTIYLKIFVPSESEPVNAKGILKWIKEEGDTCIGGIELHIIGRGSIESV